MEYNDKILVDLLLNPQRSSSPTMSVLDEVLAERAAAERERAREQARTDALIALAGYDRLALDLLGAGSVVTWRCAGRGGTVLYYAAVRSADGRWYGTGRVTPYRVDTAGLVAWLLRRGVPAEDLAVVVRGTGSLL